MQTELALTALKLLRLGGHPLTKPIDSKPKRAQRSLRLGSESGEGIRKRTPLEEAIACQKDRRARYDAKMRKAGFKRTTIWVREDQLEAVKSFVAKVNDALREGGE